VWHLHEYIARRPISRRLLTWQVGRCDAIVANSNSVAAEIRQVLPVPRATAVITIYNAVDPVEFAPDGDRVDLDRLAGLPPAPDGTVRVGLVATYGRWKGHATFIEAMRRVASSAAVRGYIVGGALYDTSGSQYSREELASMIDAAGLTGRVGLTGFVERPSAAYRALDVVVHASTEPEPFGLVIAEGLTAGRAVVISAAGGAAELVEDGVTALTHHPGDAAGLARCLSRLTADAALRSGLGERGRQTALAMFSPALFTDRFIGVYEQTHAVRAGHHAGH
jgi:glycosyltransferase involved in cell wall biosynthesis